MTDMQILEKAYVYLKLQLREVSEIHLDSKNRKDKYRKTRLIIVY